MGSSSLKRPSAAKFILKTDSPLKQSDLQNTCRILSLQPPTQLAVTTQCLSESTVKKQFPSEYMLKGLNFKNKAAGFYLTFS